MIETFIKTILYLLFFFIQFFFPAFIFATDTKIEIDSQQKFILKDLPTFSNITTKDDDWQTIDYKNKPKITKHKFGTGIGWYRIFFSGNILPKTEKLGLYLDKIGDSDEVYLNNIKIGGEGKVGDDFIEATNIIRLYAIPENLINFSGQNLLAIRIMNTHGFGGFLGTNPIIGDYKTLYIEKIEKNKEWEKIEVFFITFFVIILFISGFIFKCGIRDHSHIAFSSLIIIYSIAYFLGTNIFYELGLKTRLTQKLIYSLSALAPFSFLLFLFSLLKIKITRFLYIILISFLLLSIFFLLDMKWKNYSILTDLWVILTTISVTISFYHTAIGVKRNVYGSNSVFIGLIILLIGTIFWILDIISFFELGDFYVLLDFTLPASTLFFLFAIIQKFSKIFHNYKDMTEKILSIQDIERNRISRDLHDTVGQSLAVLKLKIQMLMIDSKKSSSDFKKELNEIVNNISTTIEEVRNIVMDIKPSFLEKTDIIEALRWYGYKFSKNTSINFRLKSNVESLGLDIKTKDTIFKITQETLSNIIKHSGATNVQIEIIVKDDIISIVIEDDGKGFNKDLIKTGSGLNNIRDRVEVMGGSLNIVSKSDIGTKIMFTVPKK